MERVIESVGVDEAWRLRGGVAVAPALADARLHAARPPAPIDAGVRRLGDDRGTDPALARAHGGCARPAGGRAPVPTTPGRDDEGDRELGLALRLDPRVAGEGVALAEPTLGPQPPPDRLLLYGDLLRAAGRGAEASEAYDRAARAGA